MVLNGARQLGQAQTRPTPQRQDNGNNNDHESLTVTILTTATQPPKADQACHSDRRDRGLDHTFGVYQPKGKDKRSQPAARASSKTARQARTRWRGNFSVGKPACTSAPKVAKFPQCDQRDAQPNTAGTPTSRDTAPPFKPCGSQRRKGHRSIRSGYPDDRRQQSDQFPGFRVPGAGTRRSFPLQGPAISDDDYTGDHAPLLPGM